MFDQRKKGSITVYMSLSLLVMMSLIFVGLYSARIAAGRVALGSGLEESLYSWFGEYDRTLFQKYGLLFVDGGYGEGPLQMVKVQNEVEENASYIVNPNKEALGIAKDVVGVGGMKAELQGYILATDQNGAPFVAQVAKAMELKLGKNALQMLVSGLQGDHAQMENFEQRKEAARTQEANQNYDAMKSGQLDAASSDENEVSAALPQISEEKKNLIETLRQLRSKGVLSLVLPDGKQPSTYVIETSGLVSQRSLQCGVNLVPDAVSGVDEKMMMIGFLTEMFPSYTSGNVEVPMKYQVEYAVAGKGSDVENLKSVCTKLLAMREAANLSYLMSNPTKCAEADQLALAICSAFGHPELQMFVSLALKSGWAFAESILDVRELLAGGKIAVVKSEESWQLSIEALPYVVTQMDAIRHSSSNGLSYVNYLRMLLLTKNKTALTKSAMDLVEWNVRHEEGKANFQLDSCVETMDVLLSGNVGNKDLAVRELYGYELH